MKNRFFIGMSFLSLYAVEYRGREGERAQDCYHSFLALVDETTDTQRILEELHFYMTPGALPKDPEAWCIYSERKHGGRPIDDRLELGGHIGGPEHVMKAIWEEGCEYASTFDLCKLDFDKAIDPSLTPNCRAGVRSVLGHLGLNFYDVVEGPLAADGARGNLEWLLREF